MSPRKGVFTLRVRWLTFSETTGTSQNKVRPSPPRFSVPTVAANPVYDTTFEGVQGGERTSHLFRMANISGGAPAPGGTVEN